MPGCECCQGNTGVRMGGNLAPVCRTLLLVPTADISFPVGIMRFICIDLAPKCCDLLFVPTADISILEGIMRFVSLDVSIPVGILMFGLI